jgi:hypothetical protein
MNDPSILIGLLAGFFLIGPLACWLLGLFNPIGYMGRPPWAADVREARKVDRARRASEPGPDGRLPDGTYLYGGDGRRWSPDSSGQLLMRAGETLTDPADLVRDSGHVVSIPEREHACAPGWRDYYVAEQDGLGFGPGWYSAPPASRDFPKGTVWECSCGRTWVSCGAAAPNSPGFTRWRPERRRERRRRERAQESVQP